MNTERKWRWGGMVLIQRFFLFPYGLTFLFPTVLILLARTQVLR